MQSLMQFVMILSLAEIIIGMILALQYDFKPAIMFMLIAGISMAAVYYVAKTSGVEVVPDWNQVIGAWSLALVPNQVLKYIKEFIIYLSKNKEVSTSKAKFSVTLGSSAVYESETAESILFVINRIAEKPFSATENTIMKNYIEEHKNVFLQDTLDKINVPSEDDCVALCQCSIIPLPPTASSGVCSLCLRPREKGGE
jgi:hypothetical protein